ncbi:MAG TPA: TetR family transcriptional regulator [Thermotogota bacterium]|nr:TetR family transcriptional regulator [Thermotogota bacterium]
MPPKVIYDKKSILNTALKILRKKGEEALTTRNIAKEQGCSTHPIYSEFNSIKELKNDLYGVVNDYFIKFITDNGKKISFLEVGVNYVVFAKTEKNLFSYLFLNKSFELNPDSINHVDENVINSIKNDEYVQKFSIVNYNEIFFNLWVFTHGLATMTYNSNKPFDVDEIRKILYKTGELIYRGIAMEEQTT